MRRKNTQISRKMTVKTLFPLVQRVHGMPILFFLIIKAIRGSPRMAFFFISFQLHILFCYRQHQFDTVQLVYFTRARIVIHGHHVRVRIHLTELFNYPLPYNVVRQASKGLNANNIRCSMRDQLYHFPGQEPAFAVKVADRKEGFCHFFHIPNRYGRRKTLTLFQGTGSRFSHQINRRDCQRRNNFTFLAF